MRIVNHSRIRHLLRFAIGIIALSFVLDSGVPDAFSQGPSAPTQGGLTGTWTGDDKGTYYVRQVGEVVWWMGKSQDGGVTYTNVFRGVRTANQITGFWADVPAGKNTGSGSLTLSVSATGGIVEIRKVNETGGFGPSLWKKRGAAQPTTGASQPPPPTSSCFVLGAVRNDKPQYATQITLYRPNGTMAFSARVVNGEYTIPNVPVGTYEVRGTGRYPRGTTPSGRPTGLGIFSKGSRELTCRPDGFFTAVDFEIRSIEG